MNPVRKFIREITGLAADDRRYARERAELAEEVQVSLGMASSLAEARRDRDLAHQENARLNTHIHAQLRQIKDDQELIADLRSSQASLYDLVEEVKLNNKNMADELREWNRKCEALKEELAARNKRIAGLCELNRRFNADSQKSWNDYRAARVLIRDMFFLASEHLVSQNNEVMYAASIIANSIKGINTP